MEDTDTNGVKATQLAAFIPQEMRSRLEEIARAEDRSLSSVVRLALADWLARRTQG